MSKRDDPMRRVYCRDCTQGKDFIGNGCYCQQRQERVCAGDRYGHPITFCRGGYRSKGRAVMPKYRIGDTFEANGRRLVVRPTTASGLSCVLCFFEAMCTKPQTREKVYDIIGSCGARYFELIDEK